jgi:hypothetical protein
MADHLDAPGLTSPNGDPKTDITDIYAFQKPGDPSKSILILNVNPLAPTLATSFDPAAIYELNIDTNGDAIADRSFRFLFSEVEHGRQTATVHLATGLGGKDKDNDKDKDKDKDNDKFKDKGEKIIHDAPVSLGHAAEITKQGPYKFFAGLRSDPFFFDLMGFLNNFKFTGSDFFIDKNVFGIVLEMPNTALGPHPKIGIWARTLIPQGDDLVRDDRMGRPAINTVFNHGNSKNIFNSIDPSADRSALNADGVTFVQSFVATLGSFGHSTAEAQAITDILLPDVLQYDYSSSAGFLNGRRLQDDVIDIELNLVTNGAVTSDMVGPHTDYLSEFPYLGIPH